MTVPNPFNLHVLKMTAFVIDKVNKVNKIDRIDLYVKRVQNHFTKLIR